MVTHQGGNYWTLFPPLIWKVLHAGLQVWLLNVCGMIILRYNFEGRPRSLSRIHYAFKDMTQSYSTFGNAMNKRALKVIVMSDWKRLCSSIANIPARIAIKSTGNSSSNQASFIKMYRLGHILADPAVTGEDA